MRLYPAVFALCALATFTPVPGAESGAPLESSKQGLRKLESGQGASRGPNAKEGLRTDTPGLHIPGQEEMSTPALITPEKLEKQRKAEKESEERKNWLVNGVRRLEAAEKSQTSENRRTGNAAPPVSQDAPKPSPDDPQYLLRLYDEQKKAETSRQGEVAPARKPQADPFAPFLQGWLGNSPARGPAFDEFSRRAAAPVGNPGVVAPLGASVLGEPAASVFVPGAPASGQSAPAPNPYLASSGAPSTGLESPLTSSVINQPIISPVAALPAAPVTVPAPFPEVRSNERKAPPPPQAEDKKYFPQLNRF
jgi:hypothetical protein